VEILEACSNHSRQITKLKFAQSRQRFINVSRKGKKNQNSNKNKKLDCLSMGGRDERVAVVFHNFASPCKHYPFALDRCYSPACYTPNNSTVSGLLGSQKFGIKQTHFSSHTPFSHQFE